jgi:integrase
MARGMGRVFQLKYKNRKTGEVQKTETWYIEYYVRGRRHRESTGTTNKTEAVAILQMKKGGIHSGTYRAGIDKVKMRDLLPLVIQDYEKNEKKSLRSARGHVTRLIERLGNVPVTQITIAAGDYVAERFAEKPKPAPSTVHHEVGFLLRALRLAHKSGRIPFLPALPTISNWDRVRTGFFEAEDVDNLCAVVRDHLKPVIRFAWLTGWRRSEILGLEWSRVDFKDATLRLEDSKNGEKRVLSFRDYPELKALLEEQRRREPICAWVFHKNGLPIRDFYASWRTACEKIGKPDAVFHDTRRSFVRECERAGVPRSTAMGLSGHKTEVIYKRYAIVDQRMQDEGIAKLRAHRGGR